MFSRLKFSVICCQLYWKGNGLICEDCGKVLQVISAPHEITRKICGKASVSCIKAEQEAKESGMRDLILNFGYTLNRGILLKHFSKGLPSIQLNEKRSQNFPVNPGENFWLVTKINDLENTK